MVRFAAVLNHPNHARQVGNALSRLNQESDVPWHRVVNVEGKISIKGPQGDLQRELLEKEDIRFSANDYIPLEQFR